jgi:hypothetical protein
MARRMTSEAMDFREVMEMARRSSSSTGQLAAPGSRRSTSAVGGAGASTTGQPTIDEEGEEEGGFAMSPEQLEKRLQSLLDTCTYTVFSYTRRGLFDRDKLIVLSLLTFSILSKAGAIDAAEYEALCKGSRSAAPPPITDDLSRWMSEGQWAGLDALAALQPFAALPKDMEKVGCPAGSVAGRGWLDTVWTPAIGAGSSACRQPPARDLHGRITARTDCSPSLLPPLPPCRTRRSGPTGARWRRPSGRPCRASGPS